VEVEEQTEAEGVEDDHTVTEEELDAVIELLERGEGVPLLLVDAVRLEALDTVAAKDDAAVALEVTEGHWEQADEPMDEQVPGLHSVALMEERGQ
jgi:hypothetical protein